MATALPQSDTVFLSLCRFSRTAPLVGTCDRNSKCLRIRFRCAYLVPGFFSSSQPRSTTRQFLLVSTFSNLIVHEGCLFIHRLQNWLPCNIASDHSAVRLSTNRHVARDCKNLDKQYYRLFMPSYLSYNLQVGFLQWFSYLRRHEYQKSTEARKVFHVCVDVMSKFCTLSEV